MLYLKSTRFNLPYLLAPARPRGANPRCSPAAACVQFVHSCCEHDAFKVDGAWRSAQCYRTPIAPGEVCTEDDLDIDAPVDPATGEEHFVVLACEIDTLDWLFLRVEGHRRARFQWTERGWQGEWIAP